MSDLSRSGTARSTLVKVWSLIRPYWQSEEKGTAWLLLSVVVGLNLGLVYLLVQLNTWNNAFYNALQNKDFDAFKTQLARFAVLAFIYIAIAVYQIYLRQMLQIRWRRWLTAAFLDDWLAHRTYYRIELKSDGTDNPDQRIQEDLQTFTEMTLSLAFDLMRSVVTLVSFIAILWGLSDALTFTVAGREISISGYMVWFALLYAIVGTWLTHKLGRPLIALNFNQQRFEADLRYGLVRLRENAEGVAFYGGEGDEKRTLLERFAAVLNNYYRLMSCNKRLNWFTNVYDQFAVIFPFIVAAPRYFAGTMQLGGLMQTASAFGRVQDALSWFVSAYTALASWKATVDRLTGFEEAIVAAGSGAERDGIVMATGGGSALSAQALEVRMPDGRVLLGHVDCVFEAGQHVLLTGPSGVGKSTLFRALAGIWPFGRGRVEVPAGSRVMFLPQRPYLPLGTLRAVVSYPAGASGFSDAAIADALEQCGLVHLVPLLDDAHRWSQRLSPGEQQRLAFARALLNQPQWLFLDEATSAIDDAMEQRLYRLLHEILPDTTLVSIAHRPSVLAFHQRVVRLEPERTGQVVLAEGAA